MKLNTVGTPSSRRGTAVCRSAGWYSGAKRNAIPTSCSRCTVASGARLITTPSASSTSAAPHADDAARLPCLAIRAPAEAATIAPIVEMFTVRAPSPPVPTRSTSGPGMLSGVARASITSASPPSSATVSPFMRSATPNPAICVGVAAPSMISFIAQPTSSAVSVSPLTSAPISAGQVVRESMAPPHRRVMVWDRSGLGGGAPGPFAHQAGQRGSQCARLDRMADHRFRARPGGEPAVVRPADDQQHRRAVMNLVLRLPAHPHAAGRLGLAVQHHHVGLPGIQQPEQGGLGGNLDDLGVRHIGCRAAPDGEPDPGPDVRIMAVNDDLHGLDATDTGGSGGARLRGVVIMAFVATASAMKTPPRSPASRPNLVSVGTIVWLSSELMFFAALFAMYFTIRSVDKGQGLPWPGAHLNLALGSINTTVLLLSSVTCQMGVFAVERGQIRRTGSIWNACRWGLREWYVLSFLMGLYFICGQGYEYLSLIHDGLTLQSSGYGSVFYIPTGFHGLHVTGGLIAFLFLLGRTYAARTFTQEQQTSAIVVSYYWHFVDVVWIGLFTTIYLIR